jgi:hypothetical protein
MNINIDVEDILGKQLDDLSKGLGKTRNALIREAVKEWIELHSHNSNWPESVLNFKGMPNLAPFESHRDELLQPKEGIFE